MKPAKIRLAVFALIAAVLFALSVRAAQAAGRYLLNAEAGFALAAESYPGPDASPVPTEPGYPGPQPSAMPTNTQPPSPTKTNTPLPSPTNTNPPPSPTKTNTPLPSPTNTAVPSATPTATATQVTDPGHETPVAPTPTHTQEPSPTPSSTPDSGQTPIPPQGRVEFNGQITAIDGETWTIGGYQVCVVSGATHVEGNPAVGDVVMVKAEWQPDGTLLALKVFKQGTRPDDHGKKVSFSGQVSAANGDLWTIGDKTVQVTGSTKVKGEPVVGDTVKVQARQQPDGSLVALTISKERVKEDHGKKVSFSGQLTAANGDQWTIGDKTVQVTGSTKIKGDPQVGDTVKVQARQFSDGRLVAESIGITKERPKEHKDRDQSDNDRDRNRDEDHDHDRDRDRKNRNRGRGGGG